MMRIAMALTIYEKEKIHEDEIVDSKNDHKTGESKMVFT